MRTQVKYLSILFFLIVSILPLAYIYGANFSLERYTWILRDVREQDIFIRTVLLGFGVAAVAIALGVSSAVLLEYSDIPCKDYFKVLIILSLLIPPYITAISYLAFLGKAWSVAETWEVNPQSLTMVRRDLLPTTTTPTGFVQMVPGSMPKAPEKPWYLPFDIDPYKLEYVVLLLALAFFPLVYLMTSIALRSIEDRMIDAALLLSSPAKAIAKISLPLVLPQILVGGLLVFIFSVSELGVPSVLRVQTLTMEVFDHFTAFFDVGQALALSIPLLALIAVLIVAIQLVLGKKPFFTSSPIKKNRTILKLSRTHKALAVSYLSGIILLSSFIPIGILTYHTQIALMPALEKGGGSVLNSLFLGALCSAFLLVPGFLIAYSFKNKKGMDYIVLLPLVVPSAALGIGMIYIWNTNYTGFIYGTFLILAIGYVSRFLPFTVKAMAPYVEQIPDSMEEAGRLAGSSFTRIAGGILAPLALPGFFAAWLVGFMLCTRELELSVMLTPPGFQTLPNRIFTLYHYGDVKSVSVLSLILIAMVFLPYFILVMLSKKQNAGVHNVKGDK